MAAAAERPSLAEREGEGSDPRSCSPRIPRCHPGDPGGPPQLPKSCPAAAEKLLCDPRFGPTSTKPGRGRPSAKCWPSSARIRSCSTALVNVGHVLANFPSRPDFGEFVPSPGCRSNSSASAGLLLGKVWGNLGGRRDRRW